MGKAEGESSLDVGGRKILKLISEKQDGVVCTGFIHLAQERGLWRALVNMVMNTWLE
jgi:hypothetical protein